MLNRPLVLVVEDDEDTCELYAAALTAAGLEVVACGNGDQALKIATDQKPLLVVLDLALPGLDGVELCRQLKAGEATRHAPVIAVTGWSGEDVVRALEEVGVSTLLQKPCPPEDLLREIFRLLGAAAPKR